MIGVGGRPNRSGPAWGIVRRSRTDSHAAKTIREGNPRGNPGVATTSPLAKANRTRLGRPRRRPPIVDPT
jgi:hypothetical protein